MGKSASARGALGALIACTLVVPLAGCTERKDSPGSTPSGAASVVSMPAPASVMAKGLLGRSITGGRRLHNATTSLERAVRARDRALGWRQYLAVRTEFRAVEPMAQAFAPLGAAQFEPSRAEEPEELPRGVGLRAMGDALRDDAVAWADAERTVIALRRAVGVLVRELETATPDDRLVVQALSTAWFEWGRRLDGSLADSLDETRIDVVEGGRALLDQSLSVRDGSSGAAARAFDDPAGVLATWIETTRTEPFAPHRKLDALRASGGLGAALRSAAAALGGAPPRAPFPPLVPRGDTPHAEPVSVATFPALRGPPVVAERARLGLELFFDARLSSTGKLSCATCHAPSRGLTVKERPTNVGGKPTRRDPMALWNVAYEPMLFWDGRASTLERQADIALEADLGSTWDDVVRRLSRDRDLVARFEAAFGRPLDASAVRSALAEFERTLVSAASPMDRFVRGEDAAMDDLLHAGFDVFYGEARCSRCHRLPLTTGTLAPRFSAAELSVIGVPTAPRRKALDADEGRGRVSRRTEDRHAFKVPSLRNLALTGPYFHNGAFRTLREVVDFYADGSGEGLGFELANFDVDARRLALTTAQKDALLAFVERGLLDGTLPTSRPAMAARLGR